MRKNRIIFCVFVFIWLLSMILPLFNGVMSTVKNRNRMSGNIVGIESTSFFNYMPGVFYIYFGRPTCPECVEFGPILEKELQKNNWTVYYFDTTYWKEDAQYERILDKYKVTSVPSLVRAVNGDYDSSYQYSLEGEMVAISELDRFMIPKYSGVSDVTSDTPSPNGIYPGFPIQFHDRLAAITFLGMLINAVYLLIKFIRKADVPRSSLFIMAMNSSLIMVLHCFIIRLGFSFTLQYNADPDQTIMGLIGKSTWMQGTPILYIGVLVMCIYFLQPKKER